MVRDARRHLLDGPPAGPRGARPPRGGWSQAASRPSSSGPRRRCSTTRSGPTPTSNILAGDVDWIGPNIGASAEIGTFDLAVDPAAATARRSAGTLGGGPQADLLDPAAIATAQRAARRTLPIDSGTAEGAYVRSGGALWFLAIARVVPQDGLPADVGDADLPRLVIGFRITTELLGDIGRRFLIENLTVGREPVPGGDGDRARRASTAVRWPG